MNADKSQDGKPRSLLDRCRQSVTAAFVVPFAVFLIFIQLTLWLRIENSALPWWQSAPEMWTYPVQCLVCLVLLWFWRRHYPIRPIHGRTIAMGAGVAGIAIWLAPAACYAATGLGGDGHWLSWLGFQERLDGFDPTLFDRRSNPVASMLTLGFRFLRLVIVVPLVEEIFWRGFLMRWLIDSKKPWLELPVGTFSWRSFLITTVLFALVHQPADYGVALIYGALAGWVTIRTRSLGAAVLMHAVANLVLGIYVMKTASWGLW